MSSDGQVSLREYLGERLDRLAVDVAGVREMVEALVDRVGAQNGRVSKLEMLVEVGKVRDEERERARQEAARVAAETAKRAATTRATLISLVGLLLSALAMLIER